MHDKDVEYILTAYRYAEKFSTDPSTQVGSILVDFNQPGKPEGIIVAYGANHFPRNVKENAQRWERPLKYEYVEHAERNSIYDAASNGIRTRGLTMYCYWFACTDCARAIIQANITEVVGHKLAELEGKVGTWGDNIQRAIGMLDEAGVVYRWVEGKLDPTNSISIRRNGEIYHP
jgi:dCMP deaminase